MGVDILSQLVYAVILVLIVCFITIILSTFVNQKTKKIVYKADAIPDRIEGEIRRLLKKNPNSDIIIYDTSNSEESRKIIEILTADFPQISVKD